MISPASALLLAAGLGFAAAAVPAASFAPENLVVYTVDNGATALNTRADPVFLLEFNPAAITPQPPVQSIALATTGTNALTASGTAASDGCLLLSSDGTFLSFGGYNATAGTTGVTNTFQRLFATAGVSGVVSYSAPFLMSTGNMRGAASASAAGGFYLLTADGIGHAASLTDPVYCLTGQYTVRSAVIFAGQLYGSTGSANSNNGINRLEGGLPTTPSFYKQLPGFTSTVNDSPNGLRLLDLNKDGVPETLYVALGRIGGGIQRYNFDGTTWTLAYTLNPATPVGYYGLTAQIDPQDPTRVRLYATTQPGTSNAGSNQLQTFTDNATPGNTVSPGVLTPVVLANAGPNQMFRGVDFTPRAAATAGTLAVSAMTLAGDGFTLTARGEAGRTYRVQSSPDLTSGWSDLSPVLYADPFGTVAYRDPTGVGPARKFYRLVSTN